MPPEVEAAPPAMEPAAAPQETALAPQDQDPLANIPWLTAGDELPETDLEDEEDEAQAAEREAAISAPGTEVPAATEEPELPANFNPADPSTWPESDIPHVRSAQAQITRYQQELSERRKALGEAEPIFKRLVDAGIDFKELEAAIDAQEAQTPQGVQGFQPQPQNQAPQVQLPAEAYQFAQKAQRWNEMLAPNGVPLDETTYDSVFSSRFEWIQAQELRDLNLDKYNQAVAQANQQAYYQQQNRSQVLSTELSRLEADPRLKPFLSDPATKTAVLRMTQNPSQVTPEIVAKGLSYDALMVLAANREKAAYDKGLKEGRSGKARASEASVPTGRPSANVQQQVKDFPKGTPLVDRVTALEASGQIKLRTPK